MTKAVEQNPSHHRAEPVRRDEPHTSPSEAATDHRFMKGLVLFGVSFVFWCLVVWPVAPFDGRLLWGDVAAGALIAGLVALVMREIVTQRFARVLNPVRYLWAAVYLIVFTYYVIKANVEVAYRVLHPSMPIRPGIVKVRSKLRSDSARTALANSITLTPGTLTIDISDDGTFYVHWINVLTVDEEDAAKRILGRFEWFIQKIFE